jgi:hypothetical protein
MCNVVVSIRPLLKRKFLRNRLMRVMRYFESHIITANALNKSLTIDKKLFFIYISSGGGGYLFFES